MLPKDKANELVNTMLDKLYDNGGLSFKRILHARAVECAKVLADEMLSEMNCTHIGYGKQVMSAYRKKKTEYWQQVKAEIEKM